MMNSSDSDSSLQLLIIKEDSKRIEYNHYKGQLQELWDRMSALKQHIALLNKTIEDLALEEMSRLSIEDKARQSNSFDVKQLVDMTIIKDKISYKNSLKQRLTILNDRLEINRNKLTGLTSNLTNVSKSLQDNHLVNVSLTERRKAIELYREIEEIESEIIITSNHYNSLETEINQTIAPLIEDNTSSVSIEERSEVTLDEVLSGQEIRRVNGESAKSFRARLQRRLSGLMLIEKELQEELKLRMSDVERSKDELKDLEIQRLRLQLQLTNKKPSSSISNDFNSSPHKSNTSRSVDINELTAMREEKKLLQSAAKLLAEDLIDNRHNNSANNVNRRLDKQLDTPVVKLSNNDIDRHVTSNPVTPVVRSRQTSRIPVSVSIRRGSSVDSSIGSPVTSGYSTRKKLGVLYGQVSSGSNSRHVDSLVISPGTESDRESVDRRVMTQLIDRLEDLSDHMDQHHAKSRLLSSSTNNDELVKSGSEYRDLLIAAIATQQEQIDILRSRISERSVSRYSSPVRSVSPRYRAENSTTRISSPIRSTSTSPIRSPKQSSQEVATSSKVVAQTVRQLDNDVVEEITSPSRSNMKAKAGKVSVEERRRQYSEKLRLYERQEKINSVTGIAVDSASEVSLGRLDVIVISARNLPAMKRLDKSSDPYVEISLVTANYLEGEESVIANAGDNRRKINTAEDTTDTDSYNNEKNLTKHTTIKWNSIHPDWREELSLGPIQDKISNLEVQVAVKHCSKIGQNNDPVIGTVSFPLTALLDQSKHTYWLHLKQPDKQRHLVGKMSKECAVKAQFRLFYSHTQRFRYLLKELDIE